MIKLKNSLLWRLILAFLVVAVTTAALIALLIRVTSADRLNRLIMDQQRSGMITSLQSFYVANKSWNGITQDWQQLRPRPGTTVLIPTINPNATASLPASRDRRRFFGLADQQGKVIISVNNDYPDGSVMPAAQLDKGTAITVNGQRVGTLLETNFLPNLNPEENLFLQRTTEALLYAVLGAMLIAMLIAIILARTLIHPLQELTQAAQNIAAGELGQKVQVHSKDEIGQLATAFNQMSEEVAKSNQLRRQMTADIAHDLRTPLTVIAGYVESMRDGVLQPTTERLTLIYTEIEQLQNLVGDLKLLSMADSGELPLHPQAISPKSLLERAAAPFQHRADRQNIHVSIQADEALPPIRVDEDRMMQVFGNLISNALRYTPSGGDIQLTAQQNDGQVVLTIADNGSGIAAEDLPYVFDRFYRGDKSRTTEAGESGLGLAIAKALVEAHHGTITAKSAPGQGTAIDITIPILAQKNHAA